MNMIGVSIGGTKTQVTYGEYNGKGFENIQKDVFKTNPHNAQETIENIQKYIDQYENYEKISVICGGPLDSLRGVICCPPHLPGFVDIPIKALFEERYHVQTTLLNDADASAYAEYLFGAGIGSRNMAYCTFGTGFGAGLILNSALYRGNNGMAGEIGHVRLTEGGLTGYGKIGSVESYCSGGKIAEYANEVRKGKETLLNQYDVVSVKEIAIAARAGDALSISIMDRVAKKLGETCSILVDLLNLDRIVLGGIYPRCKDLLEEKMMESFHNESIPFNSENCLIVASKLADNLDDYSALAGGLIHE